jgi:alpha-1,2-mannosyltransferase
MRVKQAVAVGTSVLVLAVLPLALMAYALVIIIVNGRWGSDFSTFYDSGRAVLHGHTPYPSLASLPAHAGKLFAPFVYPPVAAFVIVPLSLFPFSVATVLFFVVNFGATALALRLLGVRDWRCYGLICVCPPLFSALAVGTISPLLFLGVAAAWRYRNRAVTAGLLVAYVMTAKLFLWPLWLWLIRTRRYAAAAVAAGSGLVAVIVSWSLIGFAGMRDYPHLLSRMTELEGPHSYSLYSLARSLQVGPSHSQDLVYLATVAAVAAALVFVRGDRQWLVAAIGISLLATPILWPHNLVLLFVPVALTHRRFSVLWMAPLMLWIDSSGWSEGITWRIVGVLVFCAAIVAVGLGSRLHVRQERSGLTARPEPSLP